ncbi:hypothetical protein DAETH_09500 [Deinococcus aetherius]|uniref:Transcriptional regulator n=1 Tax=Deinococcus aetherius TaxID=200252 RepID=A0ABM8ABA7_9DEIO|nr:hypothetical protein [Deinococcus aetherius]BDP40981.1 hypothetical protein DAETH_09500 [Deinococcus aetherius]
MTMNNQLEETLALLSGGVENIDPNLAVTHLRSWQAAVGDHPRGEMLAVQLGKIAELLQAGRYTEAAASLPPLGAEVETVAQAAPEDVRPTLMRLAEVLHLSDGGLDG